MRIKTIAKKILSSVLSFTIITTSLLGLCSMNVNAAPTIAEFYGIKNVDFVKYNGSVYSDTLYMHKDSELSGTHTTINNIDASDNNWWNARSIAFCMDDNGAFPYGMIYDSTVDRLNQSELEELQQKAFARLLVTANSKDYWASQNVRNIGAQYYATQIAIWICRNGIQGGNRESALYNWEGNTDIYSYEEVGGVGNMIRALVKVYYDIYEPGWDINFNNPINNVYIESKPRVELTTNTYHINTNTVDFAFNVTATNCSQG